MDFHQTSVERFAEKIYNRLYTNKKIFLMQDILDTIEKELHK